MRAPSEQLTLWVICFGHTLISLLLGKSNVGPQIAQENKNRNRESVGKRGKREKGKGIRQKGSTKRFKDPSTKIKSSSRVNKRKGEPQMYNGQQATKTESWPKVLPYPAGKSQLLVLFELPEKKMEKKIHKTQPNLKRRATSWAIVNLLMCSSILTIICFIEAV